MLLQHGDAMVCNAGTILLDALVNERPVVCVLYDEALLPESRGRRRTSSASTTEALAGSGAFSTAESFDEVVVGIEQALEHPGELADARHRAVREIVGEVDGRAAERVVDAIVAGLSVD